MHYQDFFGQVTMRTQIGRDNWPIKSFCSPHGMPIEELRVLYNAITSDNPPTLFRKLTEAEFLQAQKDNGVMTVAPGPEPTPMTEQDPTAQPTEHRSTPSVPNTGEGSPSQSGNGSGTPLPRQPPKRNPVTGTIQRKVRWDAGMTLAQKALVREARKAEEEATRRRKLVEGAAGSSNKRGGGRGGRGGRGGQGGRGGRGGRGS